MDLITSHLNTDFDGFASMLAARKLYPNSVLVFPGGTQEHVRQYLASHDCGITKIKHVDLSSVTRLIMVDTQDAARIGSLKALWDNPVVEVHVYDHHVTDREREPDTSPPRAVQAFIEPVGASTTLMIEHLQKAGHSLTPFEATTLAIGLYEETGSLVHPSTTPRDLEAASWLLRQGADLQHVADVLRFHFSPEFITLLNELLETSQTLYLNGRRVLVATSTNDQYKGDLASVTEKLSDLEGYDAVVTAFLMDDKIQLVGRSRHPALNMKALATDFGGGGHQAAAAATIKGRTLPEVKGRILSLLTHQLRPPVLASQVMTTPAKSIKESSAVVEAEELMTKYGVNVLPAVDGMSHYVGLISRETIQKALFHKLHQTRISSMLDSGAFTATPDTPFHEIATHMVERNQRFVPIVKGKKVAGVITRTDLLRILHQERLGGTAVPVEAEEARAIGPRRNVKGLLKAHLPAELFDILGLAGQLAEQRGIQVYIVGGFVRDLLLDRPNLDIDFVVEGDGLSFARLLSDRLFGHVKTHERFGTAVVHLPSGRKFDVATARTEFYEYPTALPTVERSSLKKDLQRRDFTINALAICLNPSRFGELLDFFGGQRDLHDKAIRVLHSLSFVEDPTRAFRAVRFEQRFGFHMGKETLAFIKSAIHMDLFRKLSKPRLWNELVLILSEDEPSKCIQRLAQLELLRYLHPDLMWLPSVRALLKSTDDVMKWYTLSFLDQPVTRWVVYFMALMDVHPGTIVAGIVDSLRIPAQDAKKIRQSHENVSVLRRLAKAPSPSQVYALLQGFSVESLLYFMAKAKTDQLKHKISAYLTTYRHCKPLLTGHQLLRMGLKAGPGFKKILDRLRDAKLDGKVKNEADERALVSEFLSEPRKA